jgi:hypothetical protein
MEDSEEGNLVNCLNIAEVLGPKGEHWRFAFHVYQGLHIETMEICSNYIEIPSLDLLK